MLALIRPGISYVAADVGLFSHLGEAEREQRSWQRERAYLVYLQQAGVFSSSLSFLPSFLSQNDTLTHTHGDLKLKAVEARVAIYYLVLGPANVLNHLALVCTYCHIIY